MTSMESIIARELGCKPWQVEAAVKLLDEGNTVPFVARYRKEVTGELKDEELRTIEERMAYLRNLSQRREDIIASITEQGKMTDELLAKLQAATKLQEVEDLYLPFRPKKRTRASMARERGLEPLAAFMLAKQANTTDPLTLAAAYVSDDVPTAEAAIEGAMDIVAEEVSDRADIRGLLRKRMWKEGAIHTELLVDETADTHRVFVTYEDYTEPIHQWPSHRILAINRGEKLGALRVSFELADDAYVQLILHHCKQVLPAWQPYLEAAVKDSYKRLIQPALEREIRKELTEQADEQAIQVFGTNLKNVLLQPPLAGHVIMGLDPGYRTGCKMAIIDQQGNVLDYGAYYLTTGAKKQEEALKELAKKIRKWNVTLISIGNGTASYETEQAVSQMIAAEQLSCHYLITNEAGASVYSASKLAIQELPDLDVSIRGAVSIARRVQDPLAEAVKIDPKSIGVGQYQHDVNQKRLADTLDQVVETVVNHVGVELNTASPAILQHVAGISSTVANNIINYRQEHGAFGARKELLKVARLGPAAFTQCAGFLRIQGAKNPLDNTSVHPESYALAQQIIERLGYELADMSDKEQLQSLQVKLPLVDVEKMAKELEAGVPTVRDILDALAKPGRDPREELPPPLTRKQVVSLEDIQPGTVVKGTVMNVVDFGAFIDFGIKTNGLLHRKEFCRRNQHPSDVLAVGDVIEVEVLQVDAKRNRIGLTRPKRRAENK